jgi:hypothetical protein
MSLQAVRDGISCAVEFGFAGESERRCDMKYEVVGYNRTEDYHECVPVGGGILQRLDLLVDGYNDGRKDPESLVGQVVECAHTTPYISIAMGVRVIEQANRL